MSKQRVIFSIFMFSICNAANSPCGDWEPYKDEKCFKIFENEGFQTYENAKKTCQQQEENSNLVSIRSLEEQEFLSNFLFKTHSVVDTVWIGAKNNSNKFKWADDSDVVFTNWAEGNPINKTNYDCVQMVPESTPVGKWVNEPCNKKNLVVCQKVQTWPFSSLQEILLELRREFKNSQQNPVPIGFIYVQLPSQPEPKTLWPTVEWTNVTSEYAGLFFRAEGGSSAEFEQIQNENSPRLTSVHYDESVGVSCGNDRSVTPGTWSNPLYTGKQEGPTYLCLRFLVSSDEVRPRNKAIRIWKRTK